MEESITRRRQTKQRSKKILEAALVLFCEKGIDDTSIEDIARQAGAGPATVYRYFETKAEVAVQGAMLYWSAVSEKYLHTLEEKAYLEASGADQFARIMEIFVQIFEREFDFLKFLQEFDVFVKKYQIPQERLEEYEQNILNLKVHVTDALNRGKTDRSLCFSYSTDEVYFSVTHGLLSMMQKLAFNGKMLSSDERVGLKEQVKIMTEIILRGLRA